MNVMWHRNMCHVYNNKRLKKKKETKPKGKIRKHQERFRTLRVGRKNYEYLKIL